MSDIVLIHLCSGDAAYTVDIAAKAPSVRQASAIVQVGCSPTTVMTFHTGSVPKGDVLTVAYAAGIVAAKRVPDLLPLTHTTGTYGYEVGLELEDDHVMIRSTVCTAGRAGVETRVLTSMTMYILALVDIVKDVDRSARISKTKIISKSGGHFREWTWPED